MSVVRHSVGVDRLCHPEILPRKWRKATTSRAFAPHFTECFNPTFIMSMYPAPVLVLDGGLGTTLKDHYQAEVDGKARPLWSSHLLISDPAKLLQVQTAFADAGADIILTATYQASLEGFANTIDPRDETLGIPRADAETWMRSAVRVSRAAFKNVQAVKGEGSVALSLGAYGAVMVPSQEYTGRYDDEHKSVDQLRDWHKTRLDVFTDREEVWSGIDMVAFETVPLLAEIQAVRQTVLLAQQNSANCKREKPFWTSCVFPGNELRLPDGSSVDNVVRAMLVKREDAAMPFAIGINCTKIGKVVDLLKEYESAVKKMIQDGELGHSPALVLYPDGTQGEVYNTVTHEWEQPEHSLERDLLPWDKVMFDIVQNARSNGVWSVVIAGGCCKTTPDDIKKLRQRIDKAVG